MKPFARHMLRNPAAVIGLVILILAILIAVFGPSLFPNSPWRMVRESLSKSACSVMSIGRLTTSPSAPCALCSQTYVRVFEK